MSTFNYTQPNFTPNQQKYYNFSLSTLPDVLANDPQVQVILALLASVCGNTQDNIDKFTQLIDVDNCPSAFLPYLSSIVGYPYNYNITSDQQRILIKNHIYLHKLRGSALSIQLAVKYGSSLPLTLNDPTVNDISIMPYTSQPLVSNPQNPPTLSVIPPNYVKNSGFEVTTSTAQVFSDPLTSYNTGSAVPAPWTLQEGSFNFYNSSRTNLVQNSDFETVTQTATVFSDALTSYTGTTIPAPWVQPTTGALAPPSGGTVSFGASGMTVGGTNNVLIYAGNSAWKPVVGSDGTTKLALTVGATFTQPATPVNMYAYLIVDNQNFYQVAVYTSGTIELHRYTSGVLSTLNTVAYTMTGSTTYTLSLSLNSDGVLTGAVTPSGGTATSITYTDASPLAGGFLTGVCGAPTVTISNVSVTAPWVNGWYIEESDSTSAWGISTTAVNGKYSMSVVGNGIDHHLRPTNDIPISANQTYTISGYLSTSGTSGGSSSLVVKWLDSSHNIISTGMATTGEIGTTGMTRYSATGTSPSNAMYAAIQLHADNNTGTVTFDSIQFETGSVATQYIQNNSTTNSATVPSGATSGANSSLLVAGNSDWVPMTGSSGENLTLKVQATFTTPPTLSSNSNATLCLMQDSLNYYELYISSGSLALAKFINGSYNSIHSSYPTISAGTQYTLQMILDDSGNFTINMFQGDSATGTPYSTFTATDTTFSGGFRIGLGGDTGTIITNASVTAPWVDAWIIGGSGNDFRTAWALKKSGAIDGSYSVSAVNIAGLDAWIDQTVTINANEAYTLSGYMNTSSVGSGGSNFEFDWIGASGGFHTPNTSGTTSTTRYSRSATSPSGTTGVRIYCQVFDSGTTVFDDIQLESGLNVNNYNNNNSTTSPSQTSLLAGTYTIGYTYTSSSGETTMSDTSSITLTDGQKISAYVTNSLPNNATGINYYVSQSINNSTTLTLYGSGGTGNFYISSLPGSSTTPPPSNTTGLTDGVTVNGVSYTGPAIYQITIPSYVNTTTESMGLAFVNPAGFLPIITKLVEADPSIGIVVSVDKTKVYEVPQVNFYSSMPTTIGAIEESQFNQSLQSMFSYPLSAFFSNNIYVTSEKIQQ